MAQPRQIAKQFLTTIPTPTYLQPVQDKMGLVLRQLTFLLERAAQQPLRAEMD